MGRYTDYAPIGNTCPMINDVIRIIESVTWDLDNEDEVDIADNFKTAVMIMDDIRGANQELRDWGNEQFRMVEDLEKEARSKDEEIENLKSEIESLKKDIDYYEQLDYKV